MMKAKPVPTPGVNAPAPMPRMVVGNIAQVPHSLFDAAYPLPALIANNYGDMMSIPLYDAALLCAALILLVIILLFNILATVVLKRFVK